MSDHKNGDYKACSVGLLRTNKQQDFGNGFVISNTSENVISVETHKDWMDF